MLKSNSLASQMVLNYYTTICLAGKTIVEQAGERQKTGRGTVEYENATIFQYSKFVGGILLKQNTLQHWRLWVCSSNISNAHYTSFQSIFSHLPTFFYTESWMISLANNPRLPNDSYAPMCRTSLMICWPLERYTYFGTLGLKVRLKAYAYRSTPDYWLILAERCSAASFKLVLRAQGKGM